MHLNWLNNSSTRHSVQKSENCFLMDQIVNILGFVGHSLCCYSRKDVNRNSVSLGVAVFRYNCICKAGGGLDLTNSQIVC